MSQTLQDDFTTIKENSIGKKSEKCEDILRVQVVDVINMDSKNGVVIMESSSCSNLTKATVKRTQPTQLNNETSDDKNWTDRETIVTESKRHKANEQIVAESLKKEADDNIHTTEDCVESQIPLAKIKKEPIDAAKNAPNDSNDSTDTEPDIGTSARAAIKPAVKVEVAEASSSLRPSCRYGIRCYRRNALHRITEAHPGDNDYRRPNFPPPPAGSPDCPFGNVCYRRNPVHFGQFTHPPDTDFEKNYKQHKMRMRQRRQNTANSYINSSDSDDYDLEDPFIDDGSDADFVPDANDDDDDEYDIDTDLAEE